jgi:hypothetical protein
MPGIFMLQTSVSAGVLFITWLGLLHACVPGHREPFAAKGMRVPGAKLASDSCMIGRN